MHRSISTVLITLGVLMGSLSLGGCIVPVHDRGRADMHHDRPDRHHDRHDHDHDHDHDYGHDHGY